MDNLPFELSMELVKLIAISATVAYGWTEWAKKLLQACSFDDGKYEALWQAGIPIIAVALGALCGFWLGDDATWSTVAGGLSGGGNSLIVKVLKVYVRDKIPAFREVESEDKKEDSVAE